MPQGIPHHITQYFLNALKNKRLGHAILLLGQNTHKEMAALHIAANLLCQNKTQTGPDSLGCNICVDCRQIFQKNHLHLHYIMSPAKELREQPESNEKTTNSSSEIRIDAIRSLNYEQHMSQAKEKPHIWIITEGHRLTPQAANALLKTLEEPNSDQFFMILAPSVRSVLPTIASRCQRIFFPYFNQTKIDLPSSQSAEALLKQINEASPYQKILLIEQLSKNKDTLSNQLTNLQTFIMQSTQSHLQPLLSSAQIRRQLAQCALAIEKAQHDIKAHVNPQLVLEHLFLHSWPL